MPGAGDRDQNLDAAVLQCGHGVAAGIAGIPQNRFRPADGFAQTVDRLFKRRAVARGLGNIGGQNQLAAVGVDHGLGIAGLTELVALGFAHQFAVEVGEIGLPIRRRGLVRRFRAPAGPLRAW